MRPCTIFLRVARTSRGHRASATTRPSDAPLLDQHGTPLPTVSFAIRVNIPDERWKAAQQVVVEFELPPLPMPEVEILR